MLIVEDIIDTGLTLNYLLRYLRGKAPAAAHLHSPRQAGSAAGRDPDRLIGLRDPRPIRRRLWPRLRRAVPEPAASSASCGPRSTGGTVMHRRPMGRPAHRVASAPPVLVGCFLPWYAVGGDGGLPPRRQVSTARGCSPHGGAGDARAHRAALRDDDRPDGVDRPLLYAALAILAVVGVALFIPMFIFAPEGFLPNRAPGLWVTASAPSRWRAPRTTSRWSARATEDARAGAAGAAGAGSAARRALRAAAWRRSPATPQDAARIARPVRHAHDVASGGPRPGTGRGAHGRPPQASERRGHGRLADAWPKRRRARGIESPETRDGRVHGWAVVPADRRTEARATAQRPRRPA